MYKNEKKPRTSQWIQTKKDKQFFFQRHPPQFFYSSLLLSSFNFLFIPLFFFRWKRECAGTRRSPGCAEVGNVLGWWSEHPKRGYSRKDLSTSVCAMEGATILRVLVLCLLGVTSKFMSFYFSIISFSDCLYIFWYKSLLYLLKKNAWKSFGKLLFKCKQTTGNFCNYLNS